MAQLQRSVDNYAWYSNQFYYYHSPSPQPPYPSTVIHGSTLSSVHNPYYPSPPQSYTLSSAYNTLHQPPFNYSHFLPPAAGPPTPLSFLPSSQSVTYSSQQYQHQKPPYIHHHNSYELQRLSTWKNDDKNSEHQVFDKMPESNEIEKKVPVDTKEVLMVEDEKDGIEREHLVEKGSRGVDLGDVKGSVDKMESENFVEDSKSDGSKKQGAIIKDLDVKCSVGLEPHESKDVSIVIDVKAPITVKQEIPDKDDELVINFTVEEEAVPENAIDFSSENDCVSGASVERSLSPRLRDRNTITNSNRRGIKKDVVRKYHFRRKTNELEYELEGLFVNNGEMDVNYSALKPGLSLEHYNVILKRLESCSDSNAIEFFDWMRCKGKLEDSFGAYSLILRVLGRREEWDRAEDLIHQSFQVFNTVIYACAKKENVKLGSKWFRMMLEFGVRPNVATIGMLMSLYQNNWNVDEAEFTVSHMRKFRVVYESAYSALITIYTRLRLYGKAEEVIQLMKQDRVKLNLENWLVMLNAYSQQGKMEQAESVLISMEAAGFAPNIIAYNTIITGYGKVSKMEAAYSLFHCLCDIGLEPDETTYRSMIEGWGHADNYEEAKHYYQELKRLGYKTNSSNLVTLINLQAKYGDRDGALHTIEDMVIVGCQYSSIFSTIMQAYEKVGKIDEVPYVLKGSFHNHICLNQTSCSIIVMTYIKHGMVDDCLTLLQEKKWRDPAFESHLYHLLICSCKEYGQHTNAVNLTSCANFCGDINILLVGDPGTKKSQVLQYIHKLLPRGICTSGRCSSVVGLKAYAAKDPEIGDTVLESGILVLSDQSICCIDEFDKMFDNARSMLHEVMEQQTVSIAKAGIIAFLNARTSVLACADPSGSRYNPQNSVIENIHLSPTLLCRFNLIYLNFDKPDEFTYNMLIDSLCSKGKLNEALDMLKQMESSGCARSVITYNTLIDGFCKANKIREAEEIFGEMEVHGVSRNSVTYNTLIVGLCKSRRVDDASQLMDQMIMEGQKPDKFTYNSLLTHFCRGGDIKKAADIVQATTSNLCEPDIVTYGTLISGLCKAGRVEVASKLLRSIQMKEIALTPHAYNRVIQGLFRKKKTTEAINLFREMIEQNETAPDVVSYKIVFRGLCNGGGAIREAVDFLVELLEKGFVPEFSSLYMLAEGLLTLSMEETLIKLMNMVLTSKIK